MISNRRIAQAFSTLGMVGVVALGSASIAQDAQPVKQTTATKAVGSESGAEPASLKGKGNLTFASKSQETGVIFDNENPTLSFQFKNVGLGPVTVTNIKPACGCTAVELTKTTYAPGESGSIEVIFDPKGKRGAQARNITVFTDQENNPTTTLMVRSFVKPLVVVEPAQLVFKPSQKGAGATADLHVKGRFEDFKVTRATTTDPEVFSVEIIDNGEVAEGDEILYDRIIRVTLSKDVKPESYHSELSIRTNDPEKPIFSVTTYAQVHGDLRMTPVRMTLGRLVVGDEVDISLHVRTVTGAPFEITSANSNTVALDAEYTFEPVDPEVRNDWIVRAKGTAVNVAPRFNALLHLVTNVKDEEQATIQMYGQIRRN